jgi:hypothetical protein
MQGTNHYGLQGQPGRGIGLRGQNKENCARQIVGFYELNLRVEVWNLSRTAVRSYKFWIPCGEKAEPATCRSRPINLQPDLPRRQSSTTYYRTAKLLNAIGEFRDWRIDGVVSVFLAM